MEVPGWRPLSEQGDHACLGHLTELTGEKQTSTIGSTPANCTFLRSQQRSIYSAQYNVTVSRERGISSSHSESFLDNSISHKLKTYITFIVSTPYEKPQAGSLMTVHKERTDESATIAVHMI